MNNYNIIIMFACTASLFYIYKYIYVYLYSLTNFKSKEQLQYAKSEKNGTKYNVESSKEVRNV